MGRPITELDPSSNVFDYPGLDRLEASMLGGMVGVALEHGNIDEALAIIDQARKRIDERRVRITLEDRLAMPIAELFRENMMIANTLDKAGILTVRDLLNIKPKNLRQIASLGETRIAEVYDELERIGFKREPERASERPVRSCNRPPIGGGSFLGG